MPSRRSFVRGEERPDARSVVELRFWEQGRDGYEVVLSSVLQSFSAHTHLVPTVCSLCSRYLV